MLGYINSEMDIGSRVFWIGLCEVVILMGMGGTCLFCEELRGFRIK